MIKENRLIILNEKILDDERIKGERSRVGKVCLDRNIGNELLRSTTMKVCKPMTFTYFGKKSLYHHI